jgi:hypothetical protein
MAYMTRYKSGGFTASTLIVSDEVDGEFDQIIALLNGTATSSQIKYTHNAATVGLTVDNTGGGHVQEWLVSGVAKARIKATTGQIESTITTGTAPLVVASTTMVPNLNADTVDGKHGANLVATTDSAVLFTGAAAPSLKLEGSTSAEIELDDTGETGSSRFRILNSAGDVKFQVYRDGGPFWVDILKIDISAESFLDGSSSEFATKTHVDASTTYWSWGIFYAGAIDTSIVQPNYIAPSGAEAVKVQTIKLIYRNGTPTGSSTFNVYRKNSSGTIQDTQAVTLTSGATAGTVYETDISPDWTMAANDYLDVVVTASGGHRDISVQVHGTQSLVTP